MDSEPNALGNLPSNPLAAGGNPTAKDGITPKQNVSATALMTIPEIKETVSQIKSLSTALGEVFGLIKSFNNGQESKKLQAFFTGVAASSIKAADSGTKLGKSVKGLKTASGTSAAVAGSASTVWDSEDKKNPSEIARIVNQVPVIGGGGGHQPPGSGTHTLPGMSGGGQGSNASSVDKMTLASVGEEVKEGGNSTKGFFKNMLTMGPVGAIGGLFKTGMEVMGDIAGKGIEYAYNRINGPEGNMNSMLQVANALAPNVTLMRAASGKDISMEKMIGGLAGRMPIMGTQKDMLDTILAGQRVGALMTGTPDRNGFFESARQMQVLNPGMSPTDISRTLAGYIGSVQSQQRGVFLGQGAFTMIGQGGRYKTLAEWAEGISKFFEQQRPGGAQGKRFTPEELISQNFPGSNINAWFQMMGVPPDMVDFWWQYVLTNRGSTPGSNVTASLLADMTGATRGINLGYERLRNVTQGTRREFLMGGGMYNLYATRESADRRFNVAMQGADAGLGQMFKGTALGRIFALLPTPIAEFLMPYIMQFATSPVGLGAAALGGVIGGTSDLLQELGSGVVSGIQGIAARVGDPESDAPVGDYGYRGGTSTAHLSPDLASRVERMMRANPKLKISSGYRDTVTQNRLRRDGFDLVAPATRSKHTRGWAVDIGPTSQGSWLAKNAHRFGLQSAANQGEPWHVQLAGTMPVGDAMPVGDSFFDSIKSGASMLWDKGKDLLSRGASDTLSAFKYLTQNWEDARMNPLSMLLDLFTGGGGLTEIINRAISMYIRVLLAPMSGLASLGGKTDFSDSNFKSLINDSSPVSITLPAPFTGFYPSGAGASDTSLFTGDPVSDHTIGDPVMSLMQKAPTTAANVSIAPMTFNANITVNGSGTTQADARRVATTIADHFESEISRRRWLVT